MKFKRISTLVVGSCALIAIAGCGTVDTRATVEQLTNARIAVEAAEKAEAKIFSEENLRQAQDALAIAKDAYANQAFERAFDFAKKATIYARVASAQTDFKRSEKKLNDLKAQLEKVRQQTQSLMNSAEVQQTQKKEVLSETKSTTTNAVSQPAPAQGGSQ